MGSRISVAIPRRLYTVGRLNPVALPLAAILAFSPLMLLMTASCSGVTLILVPFGIPPQVLSFT